MRNILKATTLESKLPLLAVEHGCIISKDADITVCYEVTLPELFTVTSAEYEAMHAAWCKAIKVLPRFTVAHKQDWFVSENYQPELQKDNLSFLDRSFERHFNERPYLAHKCYLYLTKTTKERMRQQSNFSTLCRGRITPKELNHEMIVGFMEAVGQFERIINDTGYISLRRMGDDEIVGTDSTSGIIERYLSLSTGDVTCLEDIDLSPKEMRVGDKMLCLHTLSDTDDLPGKVSTDNRYERLSTDRSDCRLSFASPVGLLLPCNHIYNQYVFIDDHDENLAKFEKTARNMNSLSRYSRSNAINKEWIDRYLNEAHSYGLTSVPLQHHGLERRCRGTTPDKERCRRSVGYYGVYAEAQHHRLPDAVLGGDAGQRGGFPCRGKFLYLHRACRLLFHRRNKLPQQPVAIRYKDGGSPYG